MNKSINFYFEGKDSLEKLLKKYNSKGPKYEL